jgi:hypothetical protein
VAFFQFVSLRNKGKALFSVEESAKAHNYARWENPYESASFLAVVAASLTGFMVYFYMDPQKFEGVFRETTLVEIGVAIGVASVLSLIFFYPRSYTHVFYDRLLRFHRSYTSKQPYQWVSVDQIERITLSPVSAGGESFVMAHVIFKALSPKFMGRPWTTVRFGISQNKGVDKLRAWATERCIPVVEDVRTHESRADLGDNKLNDHP